jgi:chromosomal replication initiation ATPase DnaA
MIDFVKEETLPYWSAPGIRNLKTLEVMRPKNITDDDIFNAATQYFKTRKEDFTITKKRKAKLVYIRHCCMYLFCTLTERPLKYISCLFLGYSDNHRKHHSSIIHGRERIKQLMFENQYVPSTGTHTQDDIDALIEIIKLNKMGKAIKEIKL